jgi:hypothetical protein
VARVDSVPQTHSPVNVAIAEWRQGDCVVEPRWFAYRAASLSGDDLGANPPSDGELHEKEVPGLVMLTQTCDVVRAFEERPYVEVCPLVQVDQAIFDDIKAARRPAFAFVPALEQQRLVADLDRTMTVEKAILARWTRTPGWGTDSEARAFSEALARKRVRFAFPDDFNRFAQRLQNRIKEKNWKTSSEGAALRQLREIRVTASPSWDAEKVEVMFWFVRTDKAGTHLHDWGSFLRAWLKLLPATGRFGSVNGQVATLDDLTARDYLASDRLDLDNLSISPARNSQG